MDAGRPAAAGRAPARLAPDGTCRTKPREWQRADAGLLLLLRAARGGGGSGVLKRRCGAARHALGEAEVVC